MPTATIVLPAYNEEEAIKPVLDALRRLPHDLEIIVVDDGSTDRTSSVAHALGARVIRHPTNAGYGRSVKDGIMAATSETIVLTDADGTYPVNRIPDLISTFGEGFDMVVGARQGPEYRGTFLKMPMRSLFKFLVEFSTGTRIPDVNSGLRVFHKSDVVPYFNDLCNGFSFTTTITLIYIMTGHMIAFVPIAYSKRIGRSKVRLLRDSFRTLQYIVESIVRYNPIKIFFLLSIVTLLFGTVFSLWLGPGALFLALLSSVLVFGLGLAAESVRGQH